MRDELLNESLFLGLDHARDRIAHCMVDYNQRRPHSALGYLTPAAYAANLAATGGRLRNSRRMQSIRPARPATPPACCSTRAAWRKTCRGSNRHWMKVQWQVTISQALLDKNISFMSWLTKEDWDRILAQSMMPGPRTPYY